MIQNLNILIVDDNKNFTGRLIELLKDVLPVEAIVVASDYEEATRLFSYENFGIILLDINLPGKNGIELLKYIRQFSAHSEVIMITNHVEEYYHQQCIKLGAKYFLDKSNDFAKVPGIVRELAWMYSTGHNRMAAG